MEAESIVDSYFSILSSEFEFYRAKKINATDINYFYSKPYTDLNRCRVHILTYFFIELNKQL